MELSFKKPDLNAPRFRPKALNLLTKDFFEGFRKKHPKYSKYTDKQLRQVIRTFNELAWKTVTEERDGIELPEGLGYVFIGTCMPSKKFNTNYGRSIKSEARVRERNWESDNHLMKIFYSNYSTKYRFQNRQLWYFKGTRDFTRAASAAYREDWKKYVRVEDQIKVSALFSMAMKTDAIKKRNADATKDYDEFDFDN